MLLKVSACAMLAEVASTKHGLDYLDQRGVVSNMVELLKNAPEEPLSNLYVPGTFFNGPVINHVTEMLFV